MVSDPWALGGLAGRDAVPKGPLEPHPPYTFGLFAPHTAARPPSPHLVARSSHRSCRSPLPRSEGKGHPGEGSGHPSSPLPMTLLPIRWHCQCPLLCPGVPFCSCGKQGCKCSPCVPRVTQPRS